MTTLRLGILATALATSLGSCTSEFGELNTNPNAPVEVAPSLLLRQVTFDYRENMDYEGFTGGANLGQYFTAVGFNQFDRGDLLAPQFGGNPWSIIYRNLRDIRIVLDEARSEPNLAVYEGPALVLEAYIAGAATDMFGDVPYGAAGRGRGGEIAPAYDEQEDIYTGPDGILAKLRQAVDAMDAYGGVVPLEGDLLFGGELDGWIRMANSLRLKYMLRASAVADFGGPGGDVEQIVADGRYIATDAQNAVFAYGSAPNDFRFARAREGDFTNYVMSLTIDSVLTALDDPRVGVFFREAPNGGYGGLVNGLDLATAEFDAATISLPGTIWREGAGDLEGNYVTAWETQFILAELALRGYAVGDAKTRYEEGVRLAFAYWNTALPPEYLTSGNAAYDQTRALEQIATQRWLANIGHEYEGWIEWRRTGFPEFLPVQASLNGGELPIRFPYPIDEQALNLANYEAATSAIGGNSQNVAVWWDE